MKKNALKILNLRSARGAMAFLAVGTLAACLGTGDYDFFNDPTANNGELVDDITGGGGGGGGPTEPTLPNPLEISYAANPDVCDVDSTAGATSCTSVGATVAGDNPNVTFSLASADVTAGFSIDANTGVITAGRLARSIMTPVAGRTLTVTATNSTETATADVVFVIGTTEERALWDDVKDILKTPFAASGVTNANACITCHTAGGAQAGRSWASGPDATAVGFQWYCKNIRNKANPAGWMGVTGAIASQHYEGAANSDVDHEHANCLALANSVAEASRCWAGDNTFTPAWTGGTGGNGRGWDATAGTGVAKAGVRDSRLIEKIMGGTAPAVFTGFTGNQMPSGASNTVKFTSAGQSAFTETMLNNWYDAGAPCEP